MIVLTGPGADQRPACLDQDPELFFSTAGADVERAKAVCFGCPRRQVCLDEARALDSRGKPWGRVGVWGGLDEDERAGVRVARQARGRRRAA
jgi:hypothetical protein